MPEQERQLALRDGRAPDVRWHVRKDGSRIFIDGVLTAVRDAGGQVVAFTKVMRDVTEHKRADEARDRLLAQTQSNQERATGILESISDAFYAVDAEFRFTYISRKAEEFWQRKREDLLGRFYWKEFPAAIGSESYNRHLQVQAERKPVHYETISPILNRWIDVSIYPEAGGGLACYFRDISERKAIEEALHESEERFRTAFARAPIGMVLVTTDGHFLETNQAYRDLTGYTADELDHLVLLDLTHPEDLAQNHALHEQLIRGEIPSYTIEERYRCKEGRTIWVRATASLRRDSAGCPKEIVGLVEDIDDRKKAECERERLLRELQRSNEELSQFAYVVSHDLQAPLRTVKSFTQLLALRFPNQLDKSANEFVSAITEGVDSMEQLIRALLQYAQVGEQKLVAAAVPIQGVVDSVLNTFGPELHEVNAIVTCGELPVVQGDRVLLLQLFQNLISNALKYRKQDETLRIHIAAALEEQFWQISVQDNGIGIAPEEHERVFQPLKRLHGREIPGTGIGLAVCRKILERHGGEIWVEAELGRGSTFYFTLPR